MATVDVDCVLDIRAELGECPVWSEPEQALYWVDIYAGRLNRFDPSTGENRVWTLPEPIGSFALCEGGGVLLALKSGLWRYDLETGTLAALASPESHLPKNRLNDGRCDAQGRFWVGSMEDPVDPARPMGTLYRVGRDFACTSVADGFFVSNGLAFSPDGRTLYHSDSYPAVRTVWAWDLDPDDGAVSNRRVFVDTKGMAGRPDGAAVDADGCYWMAANDGWEIIRFTPLGAIDRRIALPVAKPSMLAFGGPRLDVIYVTSIRPSTGLDDQPQAGSLFAVQAGVTGLPEPLYRLT
ncbi:sugar lactone lactonase YvrE [Rhodoligotrophos appendicifer]|uniref:SMP-30/gluconolactonase/LRE family protein n=1 Tax=Rhodoligotrophos appendicifer TaxID=987056 RepID=UPI001186F899|nr:SMP-30/gluconolactonase/LRE family protein [Rhodoligotrophos appendicifer]